MTDTNMLAVLTAATSSFLLGGIWYSSVLFGRVRLRDSGASEQQGHPARVFGVVLRAWH